MKLISRQLYLFITESIHPARIGKQKTDEQDFERWIFFLKKELSGIRLSIGNYRIDCMKNGNKPITCLLSQLVELSNTVHNYDKNYRALWKTNQQAGDIKSHYRYTCDQLEELIEWLGLKFPSEYQETAITTYRLPIIKIDLKQELKMLFGHFQANVISAEFLTLLHTGLNQLISKRKITVREQQYIHGLMEILQHEDDWSTELLTDLLIVHDFNVPEFFLYCVHAYRDQLKEIPGLHEQMEWLCRERHRIYNLTVEKGLIMPGLSSRIYDELSQFLAESYCFVREMAELQRVAISDLEKAKSNRRFLINLPVAQFGLFIRMQMEKGILIKENVGELFQFFATHFYTANAQFISADSLQKKSTDVEFATAQKLKGQLIGMLNWLNANYNLSNYN